MNEWMNQRISEVRLQSPRAQGESSPGSACGQLGRGPRGPKTDLDLSVHQEALPTERPWDRPSDRPTGAQATCGSPEEGWPRPAASRPPLLSSVLNWMCPASVPFIWFSTVPKKISTQGEGQSWYLGCEHSCLHSSMVKIDRDDREINRCRW